MTGACVGGLVLAVTIAQLARLLLFCLALLAHRRWRIPVSDLVRLVSACRHRDRR
jgi:hypothetical protein